MTRVLGKGSFHPGKVSWVSGAFPTPLPKLGRVGEHRRALICVCVRQYPHTHTEVRGWVMESPRFASFPLPWPAVTPIPRDESWPSAAHTCLCWCLCLGCGAVGDKQGLLQTTRWEKPSGFGTAPCCRLLPCSAQSPGSNKPNSHSPSTGSLSGLSRFRPEGCEGSWDMAQDPCEGRCHPKRAGRAVYCFLHRPLPPGEAKTSSH